MKILLAGGGTAGHINPALSIASCARQADNDTQILFIGKKGNMEETLVPKAGYDIKFIDIAGFRRSLSLENIKVVFKTLRAIRDCKAIIREFEPDVVVCTGGYVSGPVMSAAKALHVPSVIHEQNVLPGMTIKLSQRYASYIATSFEDTKNYLKHKEKCVFTGNPVREELLRSDRVLARAALQLDDRPFVLAFGGSLGAERVNDAVTEYIADMVKTDAVQILFGTGKRYYDAVCADLKRRGIDLAKHKNVRVSGYIYDMDLAMAAADVVIGRAGAISISEITALGKASILIPSPNVTHNQQFANAHVLEQSGAALVLTEDVLSGAALKEKIDLLLADPGALKKLCDQAKTFGVTDASEKIYGLAKSLVDRK